MTAQEMFLQIGYVENEEEYKFIFEGIDYTINLNKISHAIWKESYDGEEYTTTFTPYEIKSIYKKLEELGWL